MFSAVSVRWRACKRASLALRWSLREMNITICSKADELAFRKGMESLSVCVRVLVMNYLATMNV